MKRVRLLLSSPATAGDPVFQSGYDRIETPRRTGYSALAEYDGRDCTRDILSLRERPVRILHRNMRARKITLKK